MFRDSKESKNPFRSWWNIFWSRFWINLLISPELADRQKASLNFYRHVLAGEVTDEELKKWITKRKDRFFSSVFTFGLTTQLFLLFSLLASHRILFFLVFCPIVILVLYNMLKQPAWPIVFCQWLFFLGTLSEVKNTFSLDFRGTLLVIFFYFFFLKNYLWGLLYWLYSGIHFSVARINLQFAPAVPLIFAVIVYGLYLLAVWCVSWYQAYLFYLSNPFFPHNSQPISFLRWLWAEFWSWFERKELQEILRKVADELRKKE